MEYVGVYKKEKMVGIIDLDEVEVNFLNRMFYDGYSFKKISKNLLDNNKNFLNLSNETTNNMV